MGLGVGRRGRNPDPHATATRRQQIVCAELFPLKNVWITARFTSFAAKNVASE